MGTRQWVTCLTSLYISYLILAVGSTCLQKCAEAIAKNNKGMLSGNERKKMIELLAASKSYIEWGSGLSTHLSIVSSGPKVIHSIENQASWCKMMEARGDIVCLKPCMRNQENKHFHLRKKFSFPF